MGLLENHLLYTGQPIKSGKRKIKDSFPMNTFWISHITFPVQTIRILWIPLFGKLCVNVPYKFTMCYVPGSLWLLGFSFSPAVSLVCPEQRRSCMSERSKPRGSKRFWRKWRGICPCIRARRVEVRQQNRPWLADNFNSQKADRHLSALHLAQ